MSNPLDVQPSFLRQEAIGVNSEDLARVIAERSQQGKRVVTMAVSKYSQYGFIAERYMVVFEWFEG